MLGAVVRLQEAPAEALLTYWGGSRPGSAPLGVRRILSAAGLRGQTAPGAGSSPGEARQELPVEGSSLPCPARGSRPGFQDMSHGGRTESASVHPSVPHGLTEGTPAPPPFLGFQLQASQGSGSAEWITGSPPVLLCPGPAPPASRMSSDPPPPYPGGPSAPLLEEKAGGFSFPEGRGSTAVVHPPFDSGPPPYETMPPPQPVFVSPSAPVDPSVPFVAPGGYYGPPGPQGPLGYYPPVGPYTPAGGQTAAVLVPSGRATTVTVLQGEIFRAAPVPTVCPHCQQAITTKITHEIGLLNFLLGGFCCFIGCDLGCCFIPCLIDEFKDVTHTCPNCKAYIDTYKRLC